MVCVDFGMSREGSARHLLFAVDKALPLKWAAPESLLVQMFSNGSDVWSLGIAIWEILTGDEPYPGLPHDQAARQVVAGMRCIIPDWVPTQLSTILQQCWLHDPKARPSAHAIVDAITAALVVLPSSPSS
jgi:serine/threonine protein kinase